MTSACRLEPADNVRHRLDEIEKRCQDRFRDEGLSVAEAYVKGRRSLLAQFAMQCDRKSRDYVAIFHRRGARSKYPPAKPGALGCEPLKAAERER